MTGAALRRNAFAIRRDESDSMNAFFRLAPQFHPFRQRSS